jgi:flagellar motor protein MotB
MRLRFFLLLLSLPLLRLVAQENAPLKWKETSFDFGEIQEENGTVYHVFTFQNLGKDSLIIESAKGNCHCTKGQILTPRVAPGGWGQVRMEYNPKGRPWEIQSELELKMAGWKSSKLQFTGKASSGGKTRRFLPVEFVQRFDFNEKSIETSEKSFRKFVEGLLPLLERHQEIQVQIESSSSYVPTRQYASNEELSKARAEAARTEILRIAREQGAREERFIFKPDDTKVQGPGYDDDYQTAPEKYTPYQYVKVRVF